jgi:hypothetical protein
MKPKAPKPILASWLTSTRAATPLSPAGAFVVQFRQHVAGAGPRFTGRVEHILTGHAARFESPEELQTFFTTVLSGRDTKLSDEG